MKKNILYLCVLITCLIVICYWQNGSFSKGNRDHEVSKSDEVKQNSLPAFAESGEHQRDAAVEPKSVQSQSLKDLKFVELAPQSKALIAAIRAGQPVQLKIGGVKRQLLLSSKQLFREDAKIRTVYGEVLLDPTKDVYVFAGGVTAPGQLEVSDDAIGLVELTDSDAPVVPRSGYTAEELLQNFETTKANMTMIGDQMVMSLSNAGMDRVLIRENPFGEGMQLRYEPNSMHQEAFGTCQSEACKGCGGHHRTAEENLADAQKVAEMVKQTGGVVPDDMDVWMDLADASLQPADGFVEGEGEQAIVATVGRDPITGEWQHIGDPVPFGEKYEASLKQISWIANLEPGLLQDGANPTAQDISSMLCRVLVSFEEVDEIYERNMAVRMTVADMTVRTTTDPLWATDSKGNVIASTWRGGDGNIQARGRIFSWGGGGAALGENFGISAWPVGIAHEMGHTLYLGHTDGADLMGPAGGPPHFWSYNGARNTSADKLYRTFSSDEDIRIQGLEEQDQILGELRSQNALTSTHSSLRNPKETAFAIDDAVVTALNTAVVFDPRTNDDHRTPFSPHWNEHLVIEETGRLVPANAGTVEIINNGTQIRFTPATGYQGEARFQYSLRGDVGNGGRGWLSRAVVGITVGTPTNDQTVITLAPGEDRNVIFTPWADFVNGSYPTKSDARDRGSMIMFRAHPDATGSEQIQLNIGGTNTTVTINYTTPTRNAVDDFYSADNGKRIRFNPLVNDEVTGLQNLEYRIATAVTQVLNPLTDRQNDFTRSYELLSATLDTPAMGSLTIEKTYRTFPNGSFGSAPTNYLVFEPADNAHGYAEISYTARDVDGTQFNGAVKILVGMAEVVRPARKQTTLRVDHGLVLETVQTAATGTGFTGTSTLQWGVVNQPDGANVTFENATSAQTVATFDTPGRYRLLLTANDNGNTKQIERWVFVHAADEAPAAGAERAPWVDLQKSRLDGWNQASWNTSALGVSVKDDSFAGLVDLGELATSTGKPSNDVWEMDLGAEYPVHWVDVRFPDYIQHSQHYDMVIELQNASRTTLVSEVPQLNAQRHVNYRVKASDTGETSVRYIRVRTTNASGDVRVDGVSVMGRRNNWRDLRAYGRASQSTTHQNDDSDYNADRAVDYRVQEQVLGSRTDATTANNWWEFTLDAETELGAVAIHFLEGQNGGSLTVYNAANASVWQTSLNNNGYQRFTSIPANTMAKRIRIQVPNGAQQRLGIREFIAYGEMPTSLSSAWSQLNTSLASSFGNAAAINTSVNLTGGDGAYVLRLTSDDGWSKSVRDVPVTLAAASTGPVGGVIANVEAGTAGGATATIDLYSAFDDAETADSALTYSVVSVSNAALFNGSPVGAIANGANFTLNLANGVTGLSNVTVRATDGNGNTRDITFAVETANRRPSGPTVVDFRVSELATVGTSIADLKTVVTDADGDALTFTVQENLIDRSFSWLNLASTGELTVDGTLPVTVTNQHAASFHVLVSDGNHDPRPVTVNVIIDDGNRVPDFLSQTLSAEKTAVVGHPMASMVLGSLNEPGETYTWSITGGNTGNDWNINSSTGELIPVNALDETRTATYSLIVQATDNGSPAASTSKTITVNVLADVAGDTDSDGLSDWWERTYLKIEDSAKPGTYTLAGGPYDDPDGDLWFNIREFAEGKHPNVSDVPDSDNDGWSDAIEELVGSYPNNNASRPKLISADLQANTRQLTFSGALPASGLGSQWNAIEGPMFTSGTQANPSWSNLSASDGSATTVDFGFTGTTTFYEGFGTLTGDKVLYDDYLILNAVGASASVGYQFSGLEANSNYVLSFYGTTDASRGTNITIGSASKTNVGIEGFRAFARSNSAGNFTGTIAANSGEGNLSGFELISSDPANRNPAPVISSVTGSTLTQYAIPGVQAGAVVATGEGAETLAYSIPFGNDAGLFAIDQNGVITLAGALDAQAVGQHTLTVYVRDSLNHPAIAEVVVNVVANTQIAEIPSSTPILGVNNSTSLSQLGTPRVNEGSIDLMVDGNSNAPVNTYWRGGPADNYSYAGMQWTAPLTEFVRVVELDMALYTDGGWFGVSGQTPAAGTALLGGDHINQAVAPVLQVTRDGGTSWTTVNAVSNYLPRFVGATVGGGSNPNPVSRKLTFVLETPVRDIDGIRIIGQNGGTGNGDGNGFIGVFELNLYEQVDPNAPVLASTTANVADGTAVGAVVADLDATDVNGGSLTYSIVSGNDAGLFSIDSNGVVTLSGALGVSGSTYTLTVQVSDGSLVDYANLTVTVTDSPLNITSQGTGIGGTHDGADLTLLGIAANTNHSGSADDMIDGDFADAYDTYNGVSGTTSHSYVGLVWPAVRTDNVAAIELRMATYLDGGWFGVNNAGPGAGGALADPAHLGTASLPVVQVTSNGGTSWTTVASTSNYLTQMTGHTVGGGANPNPSLAPVVRFNLVTPMSGINGIRVIGTEGGTASRGFVGVAELDVFTAPASSNNAPTATDATFAVAENSAANSAVGTVSATDPENDTLSYAITAGNGGGEFAINSGTGAITTTGSLNFEATTQYTLTVTVSDGTLTDTATITVNVTNVNEAPTAVNASGTLAENGSAGAAVATVAASDPDAGATLGFSITSGNTAGLFAINASGNVTTTGALNFESASQYVLTVQVSDGALTDTATVTVNVTNVNEAPSASNLVGAVDENSSAGAVVGTVSATDPDAGTTLGYTITAGNGAGLFAIAANGQVTTTGALDFETASQYVLTVQVSDGALTDTATATVNVTNVNEAPSVSGLTASITENGSAGEVVGTVSATDPDAGATLSYTITAGNDSGLFAIASNGEITTTGGLDYETATQYVLTVQVSDGTLTDTATVTVNVTNIQNLAAGDVIAVDLSSAGGSATNYNVINTSGGSIAANSAISKTDGQTRESVSVTLSAVNGFNDDPNAAGWAGTAADAHYETAADDIAFSPNNITLSFAGLDNSLSYNVRVYDLLNGQNAVTETVTVTNGTGTRQTTKTRGEIWNAATLEDAGLVFNGVSTDGSGNLVVTIASAGGWSILNAVVLEVVSPNTAPTANDSTFTLAENVTNGTSVGTVTASDPENGTLSYSITAGNAGGEFAINSATGAITTAAALDFETASQYILTVEVSDGALTDTASITVNVTNVNEAPSVSDAAGSLAENGSAGAVVATVVASDPDAGTTLGFSITSGNTAGLFAINASGNVTTTGGLDFETASQHVLTIQVSDGVLTDTATVTVNVTNVNEAPSASNASGTLAENGSAGAAVATVAATDPDAGDSLSYAITAGNGSGLFAIDTNGNVTTTGGLNFEVASQHVLTVTVTDSGALSDTATVTVNVTNVNEAPVASNAAGSVAENGSAGATVASVSASDPDAGTTLGYTITSGNGAGLFAVNASGNVTTTAGLDFETANQYLLTVQVSDGVLTDTATVTINVTNVNEAPSAANVVASVAERGAAGAVVGTVTASDPENDTLSYQITAGNDSGLFAIAANGQVTTTGPLDFEAAAQHVLTVTVSDSTLTGTATVTVNVTEDALNITAGASAIVGTHNAADLTTLGDPYQSNHSGGAADIIDNDVSDVYDTWNASGTQTHSYFGVTWSAARTDHVQAVEIDFVTYLDGGWFGTNNSGPGAGGTLADPTHVGTASLPVVQVTSDGGTTWTTVASTSNYLTQMTGQTIGGGANPNPKLMPVVRFELTTPQTGINGIRVIGSEGGTASGGFVSVAELNVFASSNLAPSVTDATFSVAERGAAGAVVGTVAASDPESDTLSYSITAGNGSGLFAIASNGQVTTTGALDFEASAQHVLTVTVTDSGALSDTATVTVNVTNVNEAPVASNAAGSVAENVASGTAVASVSASDPDAGDTLNYAITAGNTGDAFAIDASGNITTAAALDFETTAAYTLTVTVTDSGSLSDTATVNVTVTDVAEVTAPTIATGAASGITQNGASLAYNVTSDGGEASTVTLYYGTTNGGQVAGNWTSSQALGALNTGAGSTNVTGLTAGTAYFFTFRISNSAGEAWGSAGSFTTEADTSAKLVRTTVNNVSSTSWTTVDLGQSYTSAVIVATPIYPNSTVAPVVTRIRNVSGSNFELKLDRADGQTGTVTMNVSVIAVEEGVYTQAADGVTMEAVKYTSTITGRKNAWTSESRTYQNSYTNPVVVGQVMSANDANWSSFWCHGSSRTNPPNASNLNVGKMIAEDTTTTRANETVGYIVIEAGNGSINGVNYTAGLGADTVRGIGNTSTGYNYSLSGLSSASAAAVSLAGLDGGDGGWAVLYGATPLTSSQLTIAADEDQRGDSERSHTTEQCGYIVFE